MFTLSSDKDQRKQGCIPVGCVPTAAVTAEAVGLCWGPLSTGVCGGGGSVRRGDPPVNGMTNTRF